MTAAMAKTAPRMSPVVIEKTCGAPHPRAFERHKGREELTGDDPRYTPRMQLSRLCLTGVLVSLTAAGVPAQRQSPAPSRVQALVGGLLVDGYAGPPIQNSVILIDGDTITAVGQVGRLAVPAGAE